MTNKKEKIVQAETEDGQIVGEAIVQAIEEQISDNNPPETRITLERLMKAGETRVEAIRLIACALMIEIFRTMKYHEKYNNERYIKNLNNLPQLPDDYS